MKRRKPKQLDLALRTWGGKRRGAGRRPKGRKAGVAHTRRERVTQHTPVLITMKLRAGLPTLRNKQRYKVVRRAFVQGCAGPGFRITDWSIQGNHLHIVSEADNNQALARGAKGFAVRVARALNRLLGRKGSVFADRYHARVLRSPREVKNALLYVLNNARRHGLELYDHQPDPLSSGWYFDGWRSRAPPHPFDSFDDPPPVAPPRSWLRSKGWRRHRRLRFVDVPGPVGCKR